MDSRIDTIDRTSESRRRDSRGSKKECQRQELLEGRRKGGECVKHKHTRTHACLWQERRVCRVAASRVKGRTSKKAHGNRQPISVSHSLQQTWIERSTRLPGMPTRVSQAPVARARQRERGESAKGVTRVTRCDSPDASAAAAIMSRDPRQQDLKLIAW